METYSIAQVANELGTTVKRVRRLVAGGSLPAVKQGVTLKVSHEALCQYRGAGAEADSEEALQGRLRAVREVNWVDITDVWPDPPASGVRFVDLFRGAGGLSKGLELAGMEGICGLDWFDEAEQTYRQNFSHPFVNVHPKLPRVLTAREMARLQ